MLGKGFCAATLASALIALAPHTAAAEQGVTADTITIGAFGPITGPAAYIGLAGRDGANLAIKEINAAGGINGRKISLLFEDDGHSPAKALAAVKKLIDQDQVFAIRRRQQRHDRLDRLCEGKRARDVCLLCVGSGRDLAVRA